MTQFGAAKRYDDDVLRTEVRVRFVLSKQDMINCLCCAFRDQPVSRLRLTRAAMVTAITGVLRDIGYVATEYMVEMDGQQYKWAEETVTRLCGGPVFGERS